MSRAEDIFQKLIYFGEDAIDEFILNQQTEELFLDFKQAVSVGKNFTTLHRDDRKNLSKAISGFGNSEGGVIIWGGEYNKVRFLNYNQMDSIPGIEGQLNLITRPELRLPPRGILRFCNVEIILSPYIEEDFCLEGVIGADNAAPKDFRIYIPKNKLRSYVARVIRCEEEENMLLNEFFNDYFIGEV